MGSFIYYPPVDIPQEKREEFIQRMRKILDLGGMMDIQYVKFSDISLPLLRPIREMQGRLDFALTILRTQIGKTQVSTLRVAAWAAERLAALSLMMSCGLRRCYSSCMIRDAIWRQMMVILWKQIKPLAG